MGRVIREKWWLMIAVLAADQLSKAYVRGMGEPVTLIPGLLALVHVENQGMAFSMASGLSRWLALLTLAVLAVLWLGTRQYRIRGMAAWGMALLTAGALGNVIDRLLRASVTDMFEILAFRFGIFNVADMAVCIGMALMAASLLFRPGDWLKTSRTPPAAKDDTNDGNE